MILGVDLGTSVVKAAAFSKVGEVMAVEGRRVKLYNPRPECSEQDIEETIKALAGLCSTSWNARTVPSKLSV